MIRPADEMRRFYAKVAPSAGCWLWTAAKIPKGYGRFVMNGRVLIYAHRYAMLLKQGFLTSGLDVMHSCDNPPCVNPAHLSEGTRRENLMDARRKGRLYNINQKGSAGPAELAQIAAMRASGLTYDQIRLATGRSNHTIYRALRGAAA